MKIVHIAPFYWPVVGGMEKVVAQVAEYSARQGHDISIVTYNCDRLGRKHGFSRKETINNVNILRIKPTLMWGDGSYSKELLQTLGELSPEILHVHAWRHPHVFQSVKLKKKLGYKLVLHSHAPFHRLGQLGLVTWTYHRFIDKFYRKVLDEFDKIIALTAYEKEILAQKLRQNRDKIVVLPNGISDEFVDRASRNPPSPNDMQNIAMYLGRISKVKGLMLIVKAMKYVIDEVEDVELMLVGPDEGYLRNLEWYAQRHAIPLRYEGIAFGERKHELYCKCKIFVNSSMYEGSPLTLVEAQAYGRPCVITGMGGQIYASPPGITSLYSPPNAKMYGKAIIELLTDLSFYEKLSRNGMQRVQKYRWSKILPLYDDLYDGIVN